MITKQVRFLVLRGGAIGDFILTLPALHALRQRWPQAYVELVGYPHIARLALAAGLVDRVRSLDEAGMATFFSRRPQFSDEQLQLIRSFDVLVSFLHDPDGLMRRNLDRAGARQVLYGSPLVERGHAVEHLMRPLESLAIYADNDVPTLELPEASCSEAAAWLAGQGLGGTLVAVHPGSGSPKKNWSPDRFVELVHRIESHTGHTCFIVLGEADEGVAEVVRRALPQVPVSNGRSLLETGQLLSCADGFVGNDSGITHLAAALGLRTVALFGPSDPEMWGPRGSHVTTLRAPTGRLDDITVEDVMAAAVGA